MELCKSCDTRVQKAVQETGNSLEYSVTASETADKTYERSIAESDNSGEEAGLESGGTWFQAFISSARERRKWSVVLDHVVCFF